MIYVTRKEQHVIKWEGFLMSTSEATHFINVWMLSFHNPSQDNFNQNYNKKLIDKFRLRDMCRSPRSGLS
jgi:hypothetical protein